MRTGAARRRMPRAAREAQILDTALAVFGERGYGAAAMDQVAERAGVTKPVLYTHFGSKEGLLLACIARARAELLEVTSTAATAATDPEEKLRRGTLAFFDYLERNAPAWRLLYSEQSVAGDALEVIRAQQTDFIAELLGAQKPDVDPQRLRGWAEVIVGACERLAIWRNSNHAVTSELATSYLMDLVWTGLGTTAQSPR
jgi:AcrR family transcriptional regulator